MGEIVIKLPDVGEGVAEAELVEWKVKVGDLVREDSILAGVMTDKATVEIPSPADGEVIWLGAEVGQIVPIGSPIVRLKVAGEGGEAEPVPHEAGATAAQQEPEPAPAAQAAPAKAPAAKAAPTATVAKKAETGRDAKAAQPPRGPVPRRAEGERPLASPAVRGRAREAGVDLRQVPGSGPAGRITHEDLEAFLNSGVSAAGSLPALRADTSVEEIKVVGMRRKIAEKMARAKARIPHITYVEEVDVTALEELRVKLNAARGGDRPKLTLLPFLMRVMVKAIAEQPAMNAIYDDDAGIIHRHSGVHVGIATQTPAGLVVSVVRHAEARDLWDGAAEIARLSEAARNGTATREELSGSTITITSLGAMGGIATTPVINYPEVAIVGVNKMTVRPMWDGSAFVPRKMMNLSSSFDHRVIDGWDAAVFVQRIKALLEEPALIFIGD